MIFPETDVVDVLKKLARLDDMVTPWSTFTHYQPRFCLIFRQMLGTNRGRAMIHSAFSMVTLASILSERHVVTEPTSIHHPLCQFLDALLASTLPAISEVFTTIDRCDLPPPAECLIQYLLTARNSKAMSSNLRRFVDVLMSSVRPFAEYNAPENYFTDIYVTYPTLKQSYYDAQGVALHPTLPFFQLIFRIAFHFPQAVDLLVNSGILSVISKLWLQGFPDFTAKPAPETQSLTSWPEIHRRNCMIITSLFVLGSLARHRPTIRNFADHILRLAKFSTGQALELHWDVATIEARVWDLRLTEFFPQGRVVKEVHPANSLPFFLMEVCVANCAVLGDYKGPEGAKRLWSVITGIIA